jgi:Asp-tRNA(Asn)/Glu-tRNA(Gln) amidotransferase A subunit family amidase
MTPDRRDFLAHFTALGLGSTLFPGVLLAQIAQGKPITPATIAAAEAIAGISFSEAERVRLAQSVSSIRRWGDEVSAVPLDYTAFPAVVFDPMPAGAELPAATQRPMVRGRVPLLARPANLDELAYATVAELAELVRTRAVKPSELTEMYLARLRRYDPQLRCVITLTEARARQQARTADAEIAAGRYRGPLHGIPWGAKDLIAVRGYPTTWGAGPWKSQVYDHDAAVVQRLDRAGAILVAKLSTGALAQGDEWFGGKTRNPWNPRRGATGSSAGPASATAAGCVAFAIGTDTSGSITDPARICGITGLRPTFGRVPRTGVMALSWSMDALGPMCRSAEDCALVLDAIHGPDHVDRAARAYPFNWDATVSPARMRIGYVARTFERRAADGSVTRNEPALAALQTLRAAGATVTAIEPPSGQHLQALSLTDMAEGAAAFQDALRSGKLADLEGSSTWPAIFRMGQFISAADYINAHRLRARYCQEWWECLRGYDVIVTASLSTLAMSMAGLPAIVVPTGDGSASTASNGDRPSIAFFGAPFKDAQVLTLAHAYQRATDFHRRRPPAFL